VDLMSGAPSPVDQRQLDELRLRAVVKPSWHGCPGGGPPGPRGRLLHRL